MLTSLTLVGPAPAAVSAPAASLVTAPASGWTARPEDYPGTVTEKDVKIRMSDGVVLRADVERPADASKTVISTPLPVLVTITAYNKTFIAAGGAPPAAMKVLLYAVMVTSTGEGSADHRFGHVSGTFDVGTKHDAIGHIRGCLTSFSVTVPG